jgi:hypothetical protein
MLSLMKQFETVFPFSSLPSTKSASSSSDLLLLPDQFEDYAYAPSLLPNYGACTGPGVNLELLEYQPSTPSASSSIHVDFGSPAHDVDRMQQHVMPCLCVQLVHHWLISGCRWTPTHMCATPSWLAPLRRLARTLLCARLGSYSSP